MSVVDWLFSPALTAFDAPTSWAEVIGFVTGAACVWMVARQHVANWPLGIANNLMWLLLFAEVGLYADSGLQGFYIALGAWGWWQWLHGGQDRSPRQIRATTPLEWKGIAAAAVIGTAVLTWFLDDLTPSTVPFWDAVTTTLSLLAVYGQALKLWESWLLWMAADVIYVPLYHAKGLGLTALLYVGFFGLCIVGLRAWRQAYRAQDQVLPWENRCMTQSDPFGHALVMGKFFPPHLGHQLLIEEAVRQSARVTVLVLAAVWEGLPLERRVEWLRQIYAGAPEVTIVGAPCDIPVDVDSEAMWRAHVALVKSLLPSERLDAVFTSEGYGDELARRLGATHVSVDPVRERQPVSSSAVRDDFVGTWDLLHPVVRAGLTTRIVVLGAESTGTTTVSRALAEHYRQLGGVWSRTQWVPEYGRDHTMVKQQLVEDAARAAGRAAPPMADLEWTAEDFALVAATQQSLEDGAAGHGSPVLICDTDAIATVVWERRYRGLDSRAAETVAARRRPQDALYLLTDHLGVPFVQDGWRDGEHVRAAMTGWFVEELVRRRCSWVLLTGPFEDRLSLARRVSDLALQARQATWLTDARGDELAPDPE